jgi:hypothetical protein
MAIVTYPLGDCPGCSAKRGWGNIEVMGAVLVRGCTKCRHSERLRLPALRKVVLYLDQFFHSHAFRGGKGEYVRAANRIADLAAKQLLVVPHSSVHEDESRQWQGGEELMAFIKDAARGHKFQPAYAVEKSQVMRGFRSWLAGLLPEYARETSDVMHGDPNRWDSYFRIEVGRYVGDAALIRDLKRRSVKELVALFEGWRGDPSGFDEDLLAEYNEMGQNYLRTYFELQARVLSGDAMALLDAPVVSTNVEGMLHLLPRDMPFEDKAKRCQDYFQSAHFRELPYQWLHAHMLATLKTNVKGGAYANEQRALDRLSGVFFDVKHIATYAPYVDAFFMDQPMAALAAAPTVRLEQRYGVRVFSGNMMDAFMRWLDEVEAAGMTSAHRDWLREVYPE